MDIALQGASRADELIPLDDPQSHYAFSKIFEGKGWGAKGRNKRRLKILQALDAQLDELLHDGERVVNVSWGVHFSFVEWYFLGIWSLLLNQRAMLVTNERVLFCQMSSRQKPMPLKSQVRYGALKKIAANWMSQLVVTPKQGKSLIFTRVPGKMRKGLAKEVENLRRTAQPSNVATHEHLCPHCYEPIAELVPSCPKCRGTFKSPSRARSLSFLFPGLGDLYLGHQMLGWFQVIVGVFVWSIFASGIAETATAEGDAAVNLVAAGVMALFLVVFLHGIDAAVTGHTAKKGLYPEKRGPLTR
jgi:hypothetical protein